MVEDFFKFNTGNEFRFSNFREIKEEDLKNADEKTKKLFNIFAGEDKILQEAEAKSLFNVLKSAAGDNKVLEENEIKAFAEEKLGEEIDTNAFTTFVNNIFGAKEKSQSQTVQVTPNGATSKQQQIFLEEAACKEIAINIIDENISEAYEILNSQYLGSISGWHDERKDKNDILKTSNVSKVLDYQKAGIEWMNKAKLAPPNGLTKKEYYEGNKQRIKDMILTRVLVLDTSPKFKELKKKYSEEELAQIIGDYVEKFCSKFSIDDLKKIQKQFVSYSGAEEVQVLGIIVDKAIKDNNKKNIKPPKDLPIQTYSMQTGIIPEYWDTDEPISFEEVYKIERGTEYSQYKIEQYVLAKKEMEVVANAYNKKQQFIEFAEGLRKDETLNIDEKTQKVLEGFATFYALSEDGGLTQLKELIAESKLPISIDENGFNFGTLDENAKNRALNSLLKFAQQSKEKEFEKFLKGKTIEDYQIALAQAHDEAIGDENGKMMAEAMKNDNLTCIQRWTGKASMIGMGMVVVGGLLCFTPLGPLVIGSTTVGALTLGVGNTLAIGGMVAKTGLGAADYATKDVQTAEEAEQLTKDFIVDAGGFIIGMGAGKAGVKAFSKLIDKKLVAVFGQQIASGNKMQALKTVFTNPEYLKNFMTAAGAKLSADFVISYAGDLAMMGILDTQDDWQSLLKANLTGILVGMSGDIKDVSGVGKPRNFGISDRVKPMTEMDYEKKLYGHDVTVTDPKTGTTVEGTVTGVYNKNGQFEIEVNNQRFSTNDIVEVKGETKKTTTDVKNIQVVKTKEEIENDANRNSRANKSALVKQYKNKSEQWLIGEFRRLMAEYEASKKNTDYQIISDLEIVLEDRGHIYRPKLLKNFNPYGPFAKMNNDDLLTEYKNLAEKITQNFTPQELKRFLDVKTELIERKIDFNETLSNESLAQNEQKPVFDINTKTLKNASIQSPEKLNLFGTEYNVVNFFKQDNGIVFIKTDNDTEIILDKYNRPTSITYKTSSWSSESKKYSYADNRSNEPFLVEKYNDNSIVSVTINDKSSAINIDYSTGYIQTTNKISNNISKIELNQSEYPVSVKQDSKYYTNILKELKHCITIDAVKSLKNQYIAKGLHINDFYFIDRQNNIIRSDIEGSKSRKELDLIKDKYLKQGIDLSNDFNDTCEKQIDTIIHIEIQSCQTLDDLRKFREKYKQEGIDVREDIYNNKLNEIIINELNSCLKIDDIEKIKQKYTKNGHTIPDNIINDKIYDIIISDFKKCKKEAEIISLQKKYSSKGIDIPDNIIDYFKSKLNDTKFTDTELKIRTGNIISNERFQQHIFNPLDSKYDNDRPRVYREIQARLEKEMGIMSDEQISRIAHDLSLRMNIPESEVLDIMSKLTQFGSFKTLSTIANRLNQDKVAGFYKECGISINSTLNYLSEKKQITFKEETSGVQAFILDDASIKYLENLSSDAKEEFYQKVLAGKIIIYELEGTGLKVGNHYYSYTMLDGGQNLRAMTQEVIRQVQSGQNVDDVLRGDFRQRLDDIFEDNMGGKYFSEAFIETVSGRSDATPQNIATQIRPNMPDADYIDKVIETVVENTYGLTDSEKSTARRVIAKYYDFLGKVYSPDSMAELLKTKYNSIEQRVLQLGKTMDDVVYVYPESEKSFELICLQYAKTNGIDPNRIIEYSGKEKEQDLQGKVIVILDDVVGSGNSMLSSRFHYDLVTNFNQGDYNTNIIFAPITCASSGKNNILNAIEKHSRINKDFLVLDDTQKSNFAEFENMLTPDEYRVLSKVIGNKGYIDGSKDFYSALVLGFQYMTPDNNSSLGGYFNLINLNNSTYIGANKTSSRDDDIGNELRKYLANRP